MKYLTAFLFIFLLVSCADRTNNTNDMDTPTADEMETTMPDRQNPVNSPQTASPQLQSTIQAVESAGGDITALAPGTAVSNIDSWISQLDGMDGTNAIVDNLKSLKMELNADNIDGSKVSNLLSTLARETRSAGNGNSGLDALANALDAGAQKLSGK
ncbi:hypothetical protein [Lewinella sp. IMCC34183]|uniref:hypothetical protein n=1 Tax=Lewinella sp. IMCC34183 TaxID=2248762 RepID=UPI000E2785E7|nr:hypothetical protein [Lewinella sp. IMCC34183]